MGKKFDFSMYEHDEFEIENAKHSGNSSIFFETFQNSIVELKDEKSLLIYVDNAFEDENMSPIFAKDEGFDSVEDYNKKCHDEMLSLDPDYYQSEILDIESQKIIISKYSEKFEIHSLYDDENTKDRAEALTSPLAGAVIKVPLGEGILDFCYADFTFAFNNQQDYYSLFAEELWNVLRGDSEVSSNENIIKIRNHNQKIIQAYFNYTDAVQALGDIINKSLYSLINPPSLIRQNNKAYTRYKDYLINLQDEMLNLLKFCYDETYFPKLFSKMTPAERFVLYSKLNRTHSSFERREIFQLGSIFTAPYVPVTHDKLVSSLNINEIDDESAKLLANEYNLDTSLVKMLLSLPSFTTQYYECTTVFDMLMLEFTKMLEHNIKFRKCKNCGKYFIMKGNYDNAYCDRIPQGETKNCQTIASIKNYKEKISTNTAWALYNKYYKRYFARMKACNIETDVFKKWQYKATSLRDDCINGHITEKEFEDF